MNGKATLSFHPSYHAKEFGVDYGEKYHKDPLYRMEQENKCDMALYERFGEYGMGRLEPKATSISIGIQPLDFINGALGGRMLYNPYESVWTPDKPLECIETREDLERMPDIDWGSNPLFLDYWGQIDEMKALYPDLPVKYIQCVEHDEETCKFVMHTPYTTAFRLLGDRIFELMLLDEELAEAIFDYLMRQYQNLWDEICERMSWRGGAKHLHLGDCAATMLSPGLYEKFSLRRYQKMMEDYKACTIHSCGPSGHLLDLFAEVPNPGILQLGAGTDLKDVRRKFPDSHICAYFSSPEILHGTPESIGKKLWEMAYVLEVDFQINGSSVDPETPRENIKAYLEAAMKVNEKFA